jgi:hypothetical protein
MLPLSFYREPAYATSQRLSQPAYVKITLFNHRYLVVLCCSTHKTGSWLFKSFDVSLLDELIQRLLLVVDTNSRIERPGRRLLQWTAAEADRFGSRRRGPI